MTEDEMVGWHHRLNGHEFEQALGDDEGQGSLTCFSPLGHKESDTTYSLNNRQHGTSFLLPTVTHLPGPYPRPYCCLRMLRRASYTAAAAAAKSLQSCSTLCDPIDGSPPGSPVPGILQARTLEWVAISFSNA